MCDSVQRLLQYSEYVMKSQLSVKWTSILQHGHSYSDEACVSRARFLHLQKHLFQCSSHSHLVFIKSGVGTSVYSRLRLMQRKQMDNSHLVWMSRTVGFFHSVLLKGPIVEWSVSQCFKMPVKNRTTMVSLCASPPASDTAAERDTLASAASSRESQGHVVGDWGNQSKPHTASLPL